MVNEGVYLQDIYFKFSLDHCCLLDSCLLTLQAKRWCAELIFMSCLTSIHLKHLKLSVNSHSAHPDLF